MLICHKYNTIDIYHYDIIPPQNIILYCFSIVCFAQAPNGDWIRAPNVQIILNEYVAS